MNGLRVENDKLPWSQRMLFISGRISLDLAHTGGPGPYKAFERLHAPEDLSRWFALSDLALEGVSANAAELKLAHTLRWAIWKAAQSLQHSETPNSNDIDIINRAAARPSLVPALSPDASSHTWRQPATARAALSAIARDAIRVLSGHGATPIQQCSNPACPLLFVDDSRAGKRRWCSMERCGNMAKVARFRGYEMRH